jgi:hypothetical protein
MATDNSQSIGGSLLIGLGQRKGDYGRLVSTDLQKVNLIF